ncbi:MAG TPA: hypothetical protein VFK47_20225 [Ktedonobacteraceae bacterium]|nr:hypothetical protein [Ktedonobacteraceae bacterium]
MPFNTAPKSQETTRFPRLKRVAAFIDKLLFAPEPAKAQNDSETPYGERLEQSVTRNEAAFQAANVAVNAQVEDGSYKMTAADRNSIIDQGWFGRVTPQGRAKQAALIARQNALAASDVNVIGSPAWRKAVAASKALSVPVQQGEAHPGDAWRDGGLLDDLQVEAAPAVIGGDPFEPVGMTIRRPQSAVIGGHRSQP